MTLPDSTDLTAGPFRGAGRQYLLLVNGDYRRAATPELRLRAPSRRLAVLDRASGRWRSAGAAAAGTKRCRVRFELAPGDGALLRW